MNFSSDEEELEKLRNLFKKNKDAIYKGIICETLRSDKFYRVLKVFEKQCYQESENLFAQFIFEKIDEVFKENEIPTKYWELAIHQFIIEHRNMPSFSRDDDGRCFQYMISLLQEIVKEKISD